MGLRRMTFSKRLISLLQPSAFVRKNSYEQYLSCQKEPWKDELHFSQGFVYFVEFS